MKPVRFRIVTVRATLALALALAVVVPPLAFVVLHEDHALLPGSGPRAGSPPAGPSELGEPALPPRGTAAQRERVRAIAALTDVAELRRLVREEPDELSRAAAINTLWARGDRAYLEDVARVSTDALLRAKVRALSAAVR